MERYRSTPVKEQSSQAAITLHKLTMEDVETPIFSFVWDHPQKLQKEQKSVESSEINFAGHRWSIVCMRKDEGHVGIYLKWRYSDGQSATCMSCRCRYSLSIINRANFANSRHFSSTQKFTSSQALLGKSKFVLLDDLLDLSQGYLDETGKRIIIEASLTGGTTRFEKTIDVSPRMRTKKNASGFYFDSSSFLMACHRWYLRVYPAKANAHGLPAVYLYLNSKANGLALVASFNLYIGEDRTEDLNYNYGAGAKFDGFGKTLSQPLYNVEKLSELTVGVEIYTLSVFKDVLLSLKGPNAYQPQLYKDYNYNASYVKQRGDSDRSHSQLTPVEAFPDQEGNYWKASINSEQKKLTVVVDRGVHHYPQNKTKLLCWMGVLLSRDPERTPDLDMTSEAMIGYFSNFIEERGFHMQFPIDKTELDTSDSPFVDRATGELVLRFHILSLQTIPLGMRAIPRFDYQARHLLQARGMIERIWREQERFEPEIRWLRNISEKGLNLESMRDMAASRASLSGLLDDSLHEGRLTSRSSISDEMTPSSGKALSTGDLIPGEESDAAKDFYSTVLRWIASYEHEQQVTQHTQSAHVPFVTSRDMFHGTREDVSTESGVAMSDESSIVTEARSSPVELSKQKEIVNVLVKFLQQRFPVRISEIIEAGSLGFGTSTRSRMDVDLVVLCPDLPKSKHESWLPAVLHAASTFLQNACANPDPFYPLPKCSYFNTTPYSVQFTCGGVDVDVMFSADWSDDESGGIEALYQQTLQESSIQSKQWSVIGCTKQQKRFMAELPNELKEIIKVVKHWRNCIQWKKTGYRPGSYLLSLLVCAASERCRTPTDLKEVIRKLGSLVSQPELSLSWSKFYSPDRYPVEFEPPTPCVRDPTNPGYNVAAGLIYWGQFRTELALWLRSLNI